MAIIIRMMGMTIIMMMLGATIIIMIMGMTSLPSRSVSSKPQTVAISKWVLTGTFSNHPKDTESRHHAFLIL